MMLVDKETLDLEKKLKKDHFEKIGNVFYRKFQQV